MLTHFSEKFFLRLVEAWAGKRSILRDSGPVSSCLVSFGFLIFLVLYYDLLWDFYFIGILLLFTHLFTIYYLLIYLLIFVLLFLLLFMIYDYCFCVYYHWYFENFTNLLSMDMMFLLICCQFYKLINLFHLI